MAQPPLSRHIRELETNLGVALFARSGKTSRLTPAGQAFLDDIYPVPGALHRAADAARRTQTGELEALSIGFVGALLDEALLSVFHRFRQTWPTTRLNLVDLPPQQLSEQLDSRELHGAFLGVRPSRLPAATTTFKWRTEALVACLPLEHRLAQRQRARLQDLAGENFVALSHAVAPDYRDLLDGLFQSAASGQPSCRKPTRFPLCTAW